MYKEMDGGVSLYVLPFRTRPSIAMNEVQAQFFSGFHDYTVDNNVSVLENFKRLSGLRCWKYPFNDEVLHSYFDLFPDHYTNPRLTMAQEFAHLASSMGWVRNSTEWRREWHEYLHKSFAAHYGKDSRLEGWQKLCMEVGEVPGRSITQCKTILKSIHVNLVNLMNCRRHWDNHHGSDDPIPEDGLPGLVKFRNYRTFLHYTKDKRRVFPKATAKEDGFIKALLRELFHHH
ncbi:hypothetical protein IWX90DRAFT_444198 [Phyllosticta citrichinensis]|uniref:Uncharacterized protein n=1 Tax=Phyllosticta citrichinensis TaxID=1130410 RepID=A0ABR1XHP6_9PEZI